MAQTAGHLRGDRVGLLAANAIDNVSINPCAVIQLYLGSLGAELGRGEVQACDLSNRRYSPQGAMALGRHAALGER